jgi:hypothetical protein
MAHDDAIQHALLKEMAKGIGAVCLGQDRAGPSGSIVQN